MRINLLVWTPLILAFQGFAQQPAPAAQEQQPEPGSASIKVEVNEVIVPVTVTDDKGRFVSNLEKKDFQILDEGKPQNCASFPGSAASR